MATTNLALRMFQASIRASRQKPRKSGKHPDSRSLNLTDEQKLEYGTVQALYRLAKHCDYGALHDEMIRNRLAVGLRDAALSEKLQMDADLSLQTAISTAR